MDGRCTGDTGGILWSDAWSNQGGMPKSAATASCSTVPSVVGREAPSVLWSLLGEATAHLFREAVYSWKKQDLSLPAFGHWEEFWSPLMWNTLPLGNKEDIKLLQSLLPSRRKKKKEKKWCFLSLEIQCFCYLRAVDLRMLMKFNHSNCKLLDFYYIYFLKQARIAARLQIQQSLWDCLDIVIII